MKKAVRLFDSKKIRVHWDENQEKWYFSIVDVVAVLTESPNPRKYWSVLKTRLKQEGSQLATNCSQLKMKSSDGKSYKTDVADTEQLLRLIQSIPSKKAEPFKIWLARVGRERIDETEDPELSIERAMQTYLQKGYSKDWINQRLKTIEVRRELTDEWNRVGISKKEDFAFLTNVITKAWSGKTVKEYKQLKSLKKENLTVIPVPSVKIESYSLTLFCFLVYDRISRMKKKRPVNKFGALNELSLPILGGSASSIKKRKNLFIKLLNYYINKRQNPAVTLDLQVCLYVLVLLLEFRR